MKKAIAQAEKTEKEYRLPSDPWRNSWTDINAKVMFDDLGDTATYDVVHRLSSEWIHSDPRTIFRALELEPAGAHGFTEKDWIAGGLALQVACQSMLECLRVLNEHFSLGRKDRLKASHTKMIAILNEAVGAAGGNPYRQ